MSVSAKLLSSLIRPILTEKSLAQASLQQYTFEVTSDVNKIQLKQAFEMAFEGRKVQAVRLIKIPGTTKRFGKRTVKVPPRHKAIFKITGDPLPVFSGEF